MGQLLDLKGRPFNPKADAYVIVSPKTYSRCHKNDFRIDVEGKSYKLKMVSDPYGFDTVGHIFVKGEYIGAYCVEELH